MSFNLGSAQFTLDVNNEQMIRDISTTYARVRQITEAHVKQIAAQYRVQESDVKKTVQTLVQIERQRHREEQKNAERTVKAQEQFRKEEFRGFQNLLKERDKAVKQNLAEQKAQTQAVIRFNQQQYQQDLRNWRQILRERDRANRQQEREEQQRQRQTERGRGIFGISGAPSAARVGGTVATLTGFGAIASGALVAREAFIGVTDAILKQEQAILSLNAAFGRTSEVYKRLGAEQAATFKRVTSEVQQSTAAFGVLNRQSNLTSTQVEGLTKVAIDLQSAYGGDLREAFRSVAAAVLGETEALEKYGIVLQEGVLRGSNLLTEAEKRRFTTMSESEKQLIRFRALMELAGEATGKAAERADSAKGGFDQLKRGFDELSKTIGEGFVQGLGRSSNAVGKFFEDIAGFMDRFFKDDERFKRAIEQLQSEGVGFLPATTAIARFDPRVQQREFDLRQEELAIAAIQRRSAEQEQAYQDDLKRDRDLVDRQNAQIKAQGDRIIEEAERAAKVERDRIDEQIKAAERRKQAELEALESSHKAELDALEEREYARRQASERELQRIEHERDTKLDAIEETKRATLEGIEAESEAVQDATEAQIRTQTIARDRRLQEIEDNLEAELKRLETEQEAREDARIEEDRTIEDSIKDRNEKLEDAHKRRIRQLDKEIERIEENSQREIREIEKRERAEDNRHRKALRNIEDEGEEALDVIDQQIQAIERLRRQADDARRRRDSQRRVDAAQRSLTLAQGAGTPEQVAQARTDLSLALRLGDPGTIERVQRRLVELAGQGTQAIAEAQQVLADEQERLRDENLESEEDAQIAQLRSTQDRIRKELEAEKRQEEDRNRRRKERLDRDKESERDKLDAAKKAIDERRRKEDDAYEKDKKALERNVEAAKRQLEDRRRAEDRNHERAVERTREIAEEEQESTRAIYDDEEKGLIPAIRRAQKAAEDQFEVRRREAENTARKERDTVQAAYNDPGGIIDNHKKGEEAAKRAYENTAKAAKEEYERARKNVENAYKNTEGTGIIDQLENNRKATEEKLNQVKDLWEDWKKGIITNPDSVVKRTFREIEQEWTNFENRIRQRGGINIPPPVRFNPNIPVPSTRDPNSGDGSNASPPLQEPPVSHQMPPDPNEYVPIVHGAYASSYWTDQGTHASLVPGNKGAGDVFAPIGTPIYAPLAGNNRPLNDRLGGYASILATNAGHYFYFAHGNVPFIGGPVSRGQQIGQVGDSGNARGIPHLHFAIARSSSDFELYGGSGNIAGDASYWRTRDSGYMFMNPTVTTDLRTGEHNLIAERRPEMLLGGGPSSTRLVSDPIRMDYAAIGSSLNNMQGNTVIIEGDKFMYYGVAPEGIVDRWNRDQNNKSILRGVRGLLRG